MSDPADRPVAFLLPGQGSQYIRMGAGLYGHLAAFTEAMDEVFAFLGPDGPAVREDWLSQRPRVPIDHVTRSQILLFAVDYAVAAQLRSWGVRPAALLGHSVGEIAGAVLAGVFSLADGVTLMWDRIARLAAAPPGGMLAVAGSAESVREFCTDEVVVGAVNSPRQVILAGPAQPLAAVTAVLRSAGFTVYPVPASTAFHSPMLADVATGAVPVISQLPVRPPQVRLYSGYTAKPLDGRDVARPEFWASHPVAPVLFWPAVDALLGDGAYLLVETGPGQGLATVVRRHPAVRSDRSRVLVALPDRPSGDDADRESLARLADRLLAAVGR